MKLNAFCCMFFACITLTFSQTTLNISGNVVDTGGEPLIGVNVVVKGSNTGTATNIDGDFSLSGVETGATLVFSYIGYQTQEIEVQGNSEIIVTLNEDAQALDEVVVVGYGVQKKSDLTGAVGKVNADEIANLPSPRVDQLMQGRVAGVQITSANGAPGSAPTIRIRGGNSINGSNEPLWVIDGIIVGQNFDLNNINTNDIASIEILKDATSVSIYGTRGANGVVLVTTKSGVGASGDGKPKIAFNANYGQQTLINPIEFMNGLEMAEYANEDAAFRGAALPFTDLSNIPNTDWFGAISTSAPSIQNHDLSISGSSGDNRLNYYLSGNFFNQEGAIINSGIEKYIFRANFDFSLNDKLKAGMRLNFSRLFKENNKTNLNNVYTNVSPVRAIYDQNGAFTAEDPVSASIQPNPVADVNLKTDHSKSINIVSSLFLEYQPWENVILRTSLSPTFDEVKRNIFNPGILPQNAIINDGGDARINASSVSGILNENTINYIPNLGADHNLTLLGGFTVQKESTETFSAGSFNISNDVTGFNNLAFGSNPLRNNVGSGYDGFQLISYLSRVNYSYLGKYLVTLVGRLDGSSRFSDGNKYGFFPSAALAWRLSEEDFIRDLGVFDHLKLRLSYGLSGSQAINSYRTLATLNLANATFGGQEVSGVTLGRPANPNLSWETTNQFDLGLEMGFLNGRISLETDYYFKKTRDLLLDVQIPRQTGFNSQLQNLGKLQNQGIEVLINTTNFVKPNFSWESTLNLSGNRTKVLDLGGVDFINILSVLQSGTISRLIVGETVPVFIGTNYLGTWKTQEEIDASGQVGQDIGGPRFEDTNNDGVITEDDYIILGNPEADFIFGLQNQLNYKNWSLDFFIQGTYGNDVYNILTTSAFFGRGDWLKYKEVTERWTTENTTSDIPRAGAVAAVSEIKTNSENIEDGSHLRLKNITLAYQLPLDRFGIKNIRSARVSLTGTNLLLLSNFRLGDPEMNTQGNDNIRLGFTGGVYPTVKSFNFGLSVQF